MRVLLDTHVALWLLAEGDDHLDDSVVAQLAAPSTDVLLSSASVWEVAIKAGLGKLRIDDDFVRSAGEAGMSPLPIGHDHAALAGTLPRHHQDPFDRMLVAQAQLDDLTIVTRDPQLQAYDVAILSV